MERSNIANKRAVFLRKYQENKMSSLPRTVVFMDETWIYAKGSEKKSWQDDSTKSVRKPDGFEGKRFIVVHAGSKDGFVEDCGLLFASKSKILDYHGEMNSEMFTKWVNESLIPHLEEPSLVVMDNAPYHSVQIDKQPSSAWRKNEIAQWLIKNGISFEDGITKHEMFHIAKNNKQEIKYVIDELLREHGHDVLRLPPYHCQFNAIELIWARAKTYYDQHAGRDGSGDDKVLQLWEEALKQCSPDLWTKCVQHTDKLIQEWYEREILLEEVTEIIITDNNVGDSDESESD